MTQEPTLGYLSPDVKTPRFPLNASQPRTTGGGPGEDPSSLGLLAKWIALATGCRWGADARLSSANVRLPAAAQVPTTTPIRA
jgi:hypothetical protein